jgi:hypothetical protein
LPRCFYSANYLCFLSSLFAEIAFDLFLTDPRITLNTQFNIIFGVNDNGIAVALLDCISVTDNEVKMNLFPSVTYFTKLIKFHIVYVGYIFAEEDIKDKSIT